MTKDRIILGLVAFGVIALLETLIVYAVQVLHVLP